MTKIDCKTEATVTEEKAADSKNDKRKQSVYFPVDMLEEIQREALRQDRTVSWIIQRAWRVAREEILQYPSINESAED